MKNTRKIPAFKGSMIKEKLFLENVMPRTVYFGWICMIESTIWLSQSHFFSKCQNIFCPWYLKSFPVWKLKTLTSAQRTDERIYVSNYFQISNGLSSWLDFTQNRPNIAKFVLIFIWAKISWFCKKSKPLKKISHLNIQKSFFMLEALQKLMQGMVNRFFVTQLVPKIWAKNDCVINSQIIFFASFCIMLKCFDFWAWFFLDFEFANLKKEVITFTQVQNEVVLFRKSENWI